MTRRRADRDTVPEPFVSMRELAQQWHAQLNSATGGAQWAPSSADRGDLVSHLSPTTASAEAVSGHRATGQPLPQEG